MEGKRKAKIEQELSMREEKKEKLKRRVLRKKEE